MNYQEIYNKIIKNRLENPLETYTENHHIFPKSLGGNNKKSNLVKLSAREHYICHLLLTKIYNTGIEHDKMIYAFLMMCNMKSSSQKRDFKVNSRLYEKRRIEYSQMMSKKKSVENENLMWIYNPTLKISKRVQRDSLLENGWFKGRVVNWKNFGIRDKFLKECKFCKKTKFLSKLQVFCCKECKERFNFENSFLYKNRDEFKRVFKETENFRKTLRILGNKGMGGNYYIALKIIDEDPELRQIYSNKFNKTHFK